MSATERSAKTFLEGVELFDTPEGLSSIHRTECAAAIWQRHPQQRFQSWIDSVDPGRLPKARVIVHAGNVHQVVSEVCEVCGTPDCDERAMLVDDVAALANIFSQVMNSSYLTMQFDVATRNASRQFHTDEVMARLVCTYRGTGTQFGTPHFGSEPYEVFTVPTGSPMLLRGKLWPDISGSGLTHRSPPVEGTGETRLSLVLDPAMDPTGPATQGTLH
ncbi:MAG: DUF1826 domain-containing protein [Pseudomonadota bacterium]